MSPAALEGTKGAILITGASTGIGLACAKWMDARGYTVYAGVRKQSDAERLSGEGSDRLTPVILDVTKADQIAALREKLTEIHATDGLLGLINNAGIAVGGPCEFLSIDEFRRQFEVNFFGAIAVTQAVMELLRTGRGRVVNISSVSGKIGAPFLSPYSASKHAMEAWTDAMRVELRPWGIWACTVEPGAVATPIWDKATGDVADHLEGSGERELELYRKQIVGMNNQIAQQQKAGVPPERVAKAAAHALTARRPRTRYRVGPDATIGLFLRWLLPDRMWDFVVRKNASLP